MKKLPFLLLTLFFYEANSQYYYKDLVAAADISRQMKTYTANNIRKVTATGITPEGGPSTDFSEVYEINSNSTVLKITTRINRTISSVRHSFNEQGLLISTVDSVSGVKSTSTYSYDGSGKISSISNSSIDADSSGNFSQTEIHQYFYKDGKLDKMWRVINKNDSLEVRFTVDENGNVIEERNYRRGIPADPIYYYYDDKNRLTDIVRFNYKANRLMPDFLFEYDDNNRVIQKITTTSGQNIGYLIWRYLFDERGLKTKEALYNKEKQLQGRIDYTYN
jgi:antitoxin component YwqK of YwqJK toxin-antitoxin module